MGKYKITAPVANYTGEGYGLSFVKGKAETDKAHLALQLAEIGYKVEPDPLEGHRKPEETQTTKLPVTLGNTNLKEDFPGAAEFTAAGLKNYRAIFNARDEDLLGIPGVSEETVKAAREALTALIAGQGSN